MDEVLEELSGFRPSGRWDWWSGGFVVLQQVLRGRAGANIAPCLQEGAKSRAGRTGEQLSQRGSGVKI